MHVDVRHFQQFRDVLAASEEVNTGSDAESFRLGFELGAQAAVTGQHLLRALAQIPDADLLASAMIKVLRSGGPIPPSDYLVRFHLETVVESYIRAMEMAAARASSPGLTETKSVGVS